MDEPKIELPAWLPWATTACLAALVACLGELLLIERTRAQFLRDQGQLAEAALQGAQNQLEAERILGGRELERLRAGGPPPAAQEVLLLLPPGGEPAAPGAPAQGALAWSAADGRGVLRLSAGEAQPENRDYQLWLDGPGRAYPARCAVFHGTAGAGGTLAPVSVAAALAPGCRFLLIDGVRGGAATLGEARDGGSIVLASLPFAGGNSGR